MATNDQLTQAATYQSKLSSSPTAYARGVDPTASDMSLSAKINAINKKNAQIQSDRTRTMWYGPNNAASDVQDGAPPDSGFVQVLKAIQKPLNAIAGTAQYAMGQGTAPTLSGSINKAMESGLTFGNIMEQNGMPAWARIPIGVSLDIAADPINMWTFGTSALIPRMGIGLAKAGPKGLVEGLTSNLASKAVKVGKFTGLAKAFPDTAQSLSKTAIEGGERYNNLIGSTLEDRMGKGILTGVGVPLVKDTYTGFENLVKKIPSIEILGKNTPTGEELLEAFKYSPAQLMKRAKLGDTLTNKMEDAGVLGLKGANIAKADFPTLEAFKAKDATISMPKLGPDGKKIFDNAGNMTMHDVKIWKADNVLAKERFGGRLLTIPDTENNGQRILQGFLDNKPIEFDPQQLKDLYKTIEPGRTGVDWYDKFLDRLESTTVGNLKQVGNLFSKDKQYLGSGDMKALQETRDAEALAKITRKAQIGQLPTLSGRMAERTWKPVIKNWNDQATLRQNFNNWRPLEDILQSERSAKAVFKLMKVPFNIASHVVANLGNLTMAKMMGIDIASPEYVASLMKARRILNGTTTAEEMEQFFFNEFNSWDGMMLRDGKAFQMFLSQSGEAVKAQYAELQKIYPKLTTAEQVIKWDAMMVDKIEAAQQKVKDVLAKESQRKLANASKDLIRTKQPSEEIAATLARGEDISMTTSSGPLTQEVPIDMGAFIDRTKKAITQLAEENPDNIAYKFLDWTTTQMPRKYEKIDQWHKMALAHYASYYGLTEPELRIVMRNIGVDLRPVKFENKINIGGDLVEQTIEQQAVKSKGLVAEKRYVLSPQKSSELALETFMNYAAMPDFVRVARALPLVGSPFYSFPYAMAAKMGKTALHNPAAFNKMAFAMSEFSGLRSPDEKKALQEKYNAYLNSPTVMKIFGMWNTDVKNIMPQYTLNLLSPSQRTYGDSFEAKMLKYGDKFPVLQTPAGQVIRDYFIQPWLLSGTKDIPQGQFGQPIMPYYDPKTGRKIDPTLATKASYALRTYLESYMPGTAGLLGPAFSGLSQSTLETLPLGYGIRGSAYAAQGKTSLGVLSKEDAVRKTLRALSARLGVPLYTLDTTKTNTGN